MDWFTDDMVGYLEPGLGKVTVLDMVSNVRRAYVDLAASQYQAVNIVQTLAATQGFRVRNAATGVISTHVMLENTLVMVNHARAKAEAARREYVAHAGTDFAQRVALAKRNVAALRQALDSANLDLGRRNKAYLDKVTGVIVKASLTGFATGALVGAAAAAFYLGIPLASVALAIAAGGVIIDGAKGEKGAAQSLPKE